MTASLLTVSLLNLPLSLEAERIRGEGEKFIVAFI